MVAPVHRFLVPPNGRGQFHLHAGVDRQVHRIAFVLTPKATGDLIDDVEHAEALVELGAEVTGQMCREFSVAPTEQYVPEVIVAAVAVHGDDRVDVPDERGERVALGRVELGAGNVLAERGGLDHAVVGRSGSFGDLGGDDVGGAFEVSAVERHETERASQLADLGDLRTLQQ